MFTLLADYYCIIYKTYYTVKMCAEMHTVLHVKCPLCLTDFDPKMKWLNKLSYTTPTLNATKILSALLELPYAYRQTNGTRDF
jgi:hypothetical protein